MKITFVNRMMGIKFGGGESFDLFIAKELQKLGHEVDFVVGRRFEKIDFKVEGFKTTYIKTPYFRDIHYRFKPTNFFYKLISSLALKLDGFLFNVIAFKVLKQKDSDIFQLCGLVTLGKKLNSIGKISSIFWPGPPSKSVQKYLTFCDIHISHGDSLNHLKRFNINLHNIPPGVDVKLFYPIKKEPNKKVRFLFVGRFVLVKNLKFLIKAFNIAYTKNKNIELILVGEGHLESSLKKLVKSDIKFVGFKQKEELAKEYQKADIFCIVSEYESFSIVTLEALASSLAIISSRVGYLPTLIKEYGLFITLHDINSLVEAILKLSLDKKLRDKISKNSRDYVIKNFSWQKSAKKLEKIYQEKLCELSS